MRPEHDSLSDLFSDSGESILLRSNRGAEYSDQLVCLCRSLFAIRYVLPFMDDVTSNRNGPYGDAWKAEPLTPSTQAVPNCCCSKGSAPYWSNAPFLIFDIRALWR